MNAIEIRNQLIERCELTVPRSNIDSIKSQIDDLFRAAWDDGRSEGSKSAIKTTEEFLANTPPKRQKFLRELESANSLFTGFWPDEMRDDKGRHTFAGGVPNRFRGGIYCNAEHEDRMKAILGNLEDLQSCAKTLHDMGIESAVIEGDCFHQLCFECDLSE